MQISLLIHILQERLEKSGDVPVEYEADYEHHANHMNITEIRTESEPYTHLLIVAHPHDTTPEETS
jgi:hypothetical protein